MNKLMMPSLLVATVLIAGMFAFMPVQQASSVHDIVQANTQKFSTVSQSTDVNDNDILVTCPATSEGCIINDAIAHDADAGQDIDINSIDYTATSITGDPVIVTASVQAIPAGAATFINNISGISMGPGDTLRIDFDDPDTAKTVNVQVTGTIEGGIADFTIGETGH